MVGQDQPCTRTGSASPASSNGCGPPTGCPTSQDNKPADGTEGECPFCRVPGMPDEDGLVVHRGELAYVVLNLYPYSPGHLMICPFRHIGDYTETTDEEVAEIGRLTKRAMTVVRGVSGAHGFNLG